MDINSFLLSNSNAGPLQIPNQFGMGVNPAQQMLYQQQQQQQQQQQIQQLQQQQLQQQLQQQQEQQRMEQLQQQQQQQLQQQLQQQQQSLEAKQEPLKPKGSNIFPSSKPSTAAEEKTLRSSNINVNKQKLGYSISQLWSQLEHI